MVDGGPFHNGASAELVIDNEFKLLGNIEDSFKPIVGVAFADVLGGEFKFQLVNSDHRLIAELLKKTHVMTRVTLPVFVLLTEHDTPADTAPKAID